VYKRIIKRLENKRSGSILQTQFNLDEKVRQVKNELKKVNEKISAETYLALQKCPIILFNGPFDPCHSVKRRVKKLKLEPLVHKLLDSSTMNGTMIGICKKLKCFSKSSFLQKRKVQYEINLKNKLKKVIFSEGLNSQALINQFHGEHDRFNVNLNQREFFKKFGKSHETYN
jgi:hypothetical protein